MDIITDDVPSTSPADIPRHDLLGSSSWAARNPSKPVITPRLPGARATGARKVTNDEKCKQRKDNNEALEKHLAKYTEAQQKFIKEASAKYGQSTDYISNLLHNHSNFKTSRAVSWHNAMIHHKSVEINQGK